MNYRILDSNEIVKDGDEFRRRHRGKQRWLQIINPMYLGAKVSYMQKMYFHAIEVRRIVQDSNSDKEIDRLIDKVLKAYRRD